MALKDPKQVSVNLSGPILKLQLELAEAYGLDPGEYRRWLLTEAVKAALIEFRAAHQVSPAEYLESREPSE